MKKTLILTLIMVAAVVCSLGSIRTHRLSKITHTLDESGAGNFNNVQQYRLIYNSVNPARVNSFYTMSWEPVGEYWFRTEFRQISYDANGEFAVLLEDIFQPGFPPYRRYVRQYNGQNQLTTSYCEMYFNENWVSNIRYNYIYNEGVLISRDDYHFEYYSNTENFVSNSYTLDGQGRIIAENRFYSPDSIHWELDSNCTYAYHPNDQSTGEEYAQYLAQIDMKSYLFDIPAYGMITEMVEMAMIDSVMTYSQRRLCTYDDGNRLASIESHYWADDWQNYSKSEYAYNNAGYLLSVSNRYWDYDLGAWAPVTEIILLEWEEPTANDEDIQPATAISLTTYPNPFNSELTISLNSKIRASIRTYIYNIRGQKVRDFEISKSSSITWDGKDNNNQTVSNGIYFIKAEQDGRTITRKVIRMK